jgi:hypothetical protein
MNDLAVAYPAMHVRLSHTLALQSINKIEENTLHELYERQLITPKLYIALKEELLQ